MTQDILNRKQSMLDDLPRYYGEIPEVDAIMQADASEIERARYNARDLLAQISATTATWGLSDWERVLELPPRPNSSDEIRRARILAKLRGTAPATIANMLAIVNAHVPNSDAKIYELVAPGMFTIDIPTQVGIDLENLRADLEMFKPAHLAYGVTLISDNTLTSAALTQSGINVTVYPYHPEELTQYAQIGHWGATINAQTTTIYPKGDD